MGTHLLAAAANAKAAQGQGEKDTLEGRKEGSERASEHEDYILAGA